MPDPLRSSSRILTVLAPAAALLATALALGGCGDAQPLASAPSSATTARAGGLPGTGKPPITVGDKNFTEQFVLGQLYAQALEGQGYSVQVNPNIGPTEVTLGALTSGRLSMYPESLGTWNTTVAGSKQSYRSPDAAYAAARRYAGAHGLELLRPTPFSDTGGIAVLVSYASEHRLRTIADLRRVAPMLAIGGAPQVQQSSTGLPAVEQAYGLVPAAFKPLEIGSQYSALDQRLVQAAVVSTTDGQLDSGNYTLLRDPLHAFGFGQAMPVVPAKVLAAEGPDFASTINRVTALLDTASIRQLNAAVDVYNQDPAIAARHFLQAHSLVPLGASAG
jgi:osmoprotectant transport system substrate-binding protein